jgi:hypothetical protein
MHQHECNTQIFLFDLENQTKGFFLYYIPCKENKCWKNFKIMRKVLLIILSIHILKLEISGCDIGSMAGLMFKEEKKTESWSLIEQSVEAPRSPSIAARNLVGTTSGRPCRCADLKESLNQRCPVSEDTQ